MIRRLQNGVWAGFVLLALAALAVLFDVAVARAQDARAPDLVLDGALTGAAHQTYVEVPFKVPSGVERLTVEFAYTGKAQRSVIDLGLRDPERFRGWSGGNKSRFTVSESDATPSYLPGPLKAGTWRLVLGVPNLRKDARADYVAKVWFERKGQAFQGFAPVAPEGEGRWWRGDLHMHTGHSDGSCLSRRGVKVPCPLFKTADAAAARGLDFIAITDHNATSHHAAMRELSPYFDDLLMIPGREITTFHGHANVWGPTAFLDFQLGSPRARALGVIQDQVAAAGGLLSINHPGLPSGEACMGCGWTAQDVDYARVAAIEVVNGGVAEGPLSGLPFWEARLNAGFRITGVGGSDNHDAALPAARAPAIGVPTTVVWSKALSQPAILAAIASGRVFLDLEGTRDRVLDLTGQAGSARAHMGGALVAPAGTPVRLEVRVEGVGDPMVALAGAGAGLKGRREGAAWIFDLVSDGQRGWVRADVRDATGRRLLIGNPIYLNP